MSSTSGFFVGVTLVASLFSGTAALGAEPIGHVAEIVGKARLIFSGQELAAGTPVHGGDEILTESGARLRVILDDGVALQFGPSTRAKIDGPERNAASVHLLAGSVLSRIRLKEGARKGYEVRTASATMGVRGTTFYVEEVPLKPTYLCVCEGTVEAKWKHHKASITAKHHDAPALLDPDKKKPTPAPMGSGHTDEDIDALQKLLDASAQAST